MKDDKIDAVLQPLADFLVQAVPALQIPALAVSVHHQHDRIDVFSSVCTDPSATTMTTTTETRFSLGSATAQLAAVALALLVRDGKLQWTDTLVPTLFAETELIDAAAGLLTVLDLVRACRPQPITCAPSVAVPRLPWSPTPPSHVASELVERVSGTAFRDFVARRLLGPVGVHAYHWCSSPPLPLPTSLLAAEAHMAEPRMSLDATLAKYAWNPVAPLECIKSELVPSVVGCYGFYTAAVADRPPVPSSFSSARDGSGTVVVGACSEHACHVRSTTAGCLWVSAEDAGQWASGWPSLLAPTTTTNGEWAMDPVLLEALCVPEPVWNPYSQLAALIGRHGTNGAIESLGVGPGSTAYTVTVSTGTTTTTIAVLESHSSAPSLGPTVAQLALALLLEPQPKQRSWQQVLDAAVAGLPAHKLSYVLCDVDWVLHPALGMSPPHSSSLELQKPPIKRKDAIHDDLAGVYYTPRVGYVMVLALGGAALTLNWAAGGAGRSLEPMPLIDEEVSRRRFLVWPDREEVHFRPVPTAAKDITTPPAPKKRLGNAWRAPIRYELHVRCHVLRRVD
ncbi:hypothetical protein BC828DRAFT_404772 [Blastocladiella britannica]|nr:hypothetical protein BC828DRAFT_404772 [Blastocladiella britannica]